MSEEVILEAITAGGETLLSEVLEAGELPTSKKSALSSACVKWT